MSELREDLLGLGALPSVRQPWAREEVPLPAWPGGAKAAVSVSFDVDGETGHDTPQPAEAPGLTALSENAFGIARGLPRILDMLARLELKSTFYVPGATALRHPALISRVLEEGHEVAHHGFLHASPIETSFWRQREEIERGLEALDKVLGIVPTGYRAPCWTPTVATYDLLHEHGFRYDSSHMEDDRPYLLRNGDKTLVELPVHWSLDDWPYFPIGGPIAGRLPAVSAPIANWRGEVEQAVTEGRSVSLCWHPEVIGRGYRLNAAEKLLVELRERGDLWFARQDELADLV